MMRAVIRTAGVVVVAALLARAFAFRPHAVERWALYLGSPRQANAQLFLDPFPNEFSCESRVRIFRANAERAFCRSYRQWEIGTAADAELAADFDPFSPAAWFCVPFRRTARAVASRL